MDFSLQANFTKEEKTILINAHNVIHQMMEEMACTGIEIYQDSDIEEWRFVKNKIKDLVT